MRTLFDTNVIVATLDQLHEHHEWSAAILETTRESDRLLSAHCLAEAFNRLTRGGIGGSFGPNDTAAALRDLSIRASVRALDALETLEALSRFAAIGGAGARLYDYLIGHVAVVASAGRIVTWNVRHLRPLFPTLEVLTPKEAIGT